MALALSTLPAAAQEDNDVVGKLVIEAPTLHAIGLGVEDRGRR